MDITRRFLAALLLFALVTTTLFAPVMIRAEEISSTSSSETQTQQTETSVSEEQSEESAAQEETSSVSEETASSTSSSLTDAAADTSDTIASTTEFVAEEGEEMQSSEVASTTPLSEEPLEIADETATTTEDSAAMATSTEEGTDQSAIPDIEESGAAATSTAEQTESGPTIVSGDAIAAANILNIVNTNMVNSTGLVFFANLFDFFKGMLDFRGEGSSSCGFFQCVGDDVEVHLQNDASVSNTVDVEAVSGQNSIEGGEGASIETGDAYAGLNLINVVNANFVDSNYVLVTLNAFQGIQGDIVFPNLSSFFNTLAASTPASIDVHNEAVVENDVEVEATSGDNTIEGSGGNVTTGDSQATANVFNQINTTLTGGTSLSILFRVHGNWAGEIFGAPEGLSWSENGDGSITLFQTDATHNGGGSTSVSGTSSAFIRNDVSVIALTGENAITGSDAAEITTGDAYAGLNLVNIANANVIGRNWLLAIINIFGDFNGNISFGLPDLWVGGQAELPELVQNDGIIKYKLTVFNNGDLTATNVKLRDDYATQYLEILNASAEYELVEGNLVWDLGDMPPGSAAEVWYRARIVHAPRGVEIVNTLSVSGEQSDNNLNDNTDVVTVETYIGPASSGGSWTPSPASPQTAAPQAPVALTVLRTTATSTVTAESRQSRQEIVIRNTENRIAPYVVLRDILRGPDETIIQDERWDIGVMLPYEEVRIGYDITFGDAAMPGVYTLSSIVTGDGNIQINQEGNGSIEVHAVPALPVTEAASPAPVMERVTVTHRPAVRGASTEEKDAPHIIEMITPAAEAQTALPTGSDPSLPIAPAAAFVAASGLALLFGRRIVLRMLM